MDTKKSNQETNIKWRHDMQHILVSKANVKRIRRMREQLEDVIHNPKDNDVINMLFDSFIPTNDDV